MHISYISFHLLILLAICTLSWGSTSTRDPLQALNHINGLEFSPQSLLSDFYSLSKFYLLIDANLNSPEIHRELLDPFINSVNKFYFQMKKLYEENPTKFIVEVVKSDPFLMGFFFYRQERPGDIVYFQARLGKHIQDELANVSFDYVSSFVWKEFKKPISSKDPWENRILKAKAHLGILKKVRVFYHPLDVVNMIENGTFTQRSMRGVIERLEFIMQEFKLYNGKIDLWDLVRVYGTIQALHCELNGKFDHEQVGPQLDIFKLLANHFMITPNDESILIALQPEILYLCIISYNNQDERALFGYFGQPIWDLIDAAFELIPKKFLSLLGSLKSQSATVLSEQEQWQVKVYSRMKYLESH
jgi:hypothetical protein